MHTKTLLLCVAVLLISFCEVQSQNLIQKFFENLMTNKNYSIISEEIESARKKEKKGGGGKYTVPILFGALMIKSVIFPLAFKAMAVMSSIAVLLSTMSLIISSIVGYVKLAMKPRTSVKVLHSLHHAGSSWAKDDENSPNNYYTLETVDYDPDKIQASNGDRYYFTNKYPYK